MIPDWVLLILALLAVAAIVLGLMGRAKVD